MQITIDVTRRSLQDSVSELISESNHEQIQRFLYRYQRILQAAHGSTNNHQAWPGGWWDHTTEGLNYAPGLYQFLHAIRPLPFSLEDVAISFFGHDLEKPFAYEVIDGTRVRKSEFQTKLDSNAFRLRLIKDAGIVLTPLQINAITYAEGELDAYTNERRMMSPLAGMVHMLDTLSARVYHDYPKPLGEDEWDGAHRILTA